MKKTILILSILLIATACTNGNKVQNVPEEYKINNNLNKSNMENQDRTLPGHEDLAKEYDTVIMKTNLGDIKIKLYTEESPLTTNNFLNLAKSDFYNKTLFHRVITDFMIQGGDPNSKDGDWTNDGLGGPDYRFKDEINNHPLVRGSLAMANSGPGTNGSQFFIITAESTPWLDGKHTNFGEIIEGMDVVEKIEATDVNNNDHPLKDITIESIELIK